jgi:hypothetical protein
MSNQYGYIPIAKAADLRQNYSIATPTTWTFEKSTIVYGGVEESAFTQAQKDELVALGGAWFATAANFLTWFKT